MHQEVFAVTSITQHPEAGVLPRGAKISYNGEAMASETTLELIIDGRVLFASTGKWLHPLFDLERFLGSQDIDTRAAEVRDKIVGRGSAFLITRMGVRAVHAGVLSRLGKDVLDRAGVACSWDSLVDQIQCRTEGLLRDTTDPEQAYRLLAGLAGSDGQASTQPKDLGSPSTASGSSPLRGSRSPAA